MKGTDGRQVIEACTTSRAESALRAEDHLGPGSEAAPDPSAVSQERNPETPSESP
ncbi:hypothetical protein GCM10023084_15600 [Streptomyces lacrimifluminis]|uniref:Uncharacterized protein n=1 Tax=Streptomyces lacrimifluminis TaxID=1500077 RepID=A0A917KL93_9ACTN|nr:hypothetical protein GCM10012282_11110 [Streptomyces lacrimifluminis]